MRRRVKRHGAASRLATTMRLTAARRCAAAWARTWRKAWSDQARSGNGGCASRMRANTSFSSGQPRCRWANGWARPRSSRPRRALGHLETEGVVPRHAHAQVGHHQRIADHVMAQPVAGEPAQPVVQRGSGQVGSSIRVERQAQPFRRRPIKPARYGFVIVIVRRLGEHAPYQRIERHGHGAQGRDLDALRDHGIAHAVFGRHPARQTETQIDRAECQRRRQQSARAPSCPRRPHTATPPAAAPYRPGR